MIEPRKAPVLKQHKKPVEPPTSKKRQLSQSSSESESECEVILPPPKKAKKLVQQPPIPELVADTTHTKPVGDTAIPAISLGNQSQSPATIASPISSPALSLNANTNQYLQSLLELQQMHHRHAMAQQQAQFMTILQQQQHAESESSFRNAFGIANKL